jgi:hypothetical protein
MNAKPGFMQVFGRFLSINRWTIFIETFTSKNQVLTSFSAGFSLKNQVFSRVSAGFQQVFSRFRG